MSPWTAVAALLVNAGLSAACASRSVAALPAHPAPASPVASRGDTGPDAAPPAAAHGDSPASTTLAREIDAILAAPTLQTAVVGALVQSLDSGEVLYRRSPDTLLVPASNMKLVTMAVAGARLGWEYRYETRLETLSAPVDGTLRGDLFVVGTGDPTTGARSDDPLATYRAWAAQIEAAGITRITGRIVGDDDAFDDGRFGDGWTWDDFAYEYAAPVGALQFNENAVELRVRPGPAVGAPASLELRPIGSDLTLDAPHVATVAAGTPTDIDVARFPGRGALQVTGVIAVDTEAYVTRVAVDNPTRYAVTVLRDVLRGHGITVEGDAVDIDEVPDAPALKAAAPQRHVVARHRSPPLADIGTTLMKVSQNLYAETVLRTIALRPGPADMVTARQRAADTLRTWGVAPGQFSMADGSGLSRLNLLSATMIVRVLRAVARDPRLAAPFEATLPIAGRDGTLASRMKATRAEGNAVAKTGTLTGVRSLSGYVRTLDGERLVFSFLVNNFLAPSSAVDAVVDHAVERLANLTR